MVEVLAQVGDEVAFDTLSAGCPDFDITMTLVDCERFGDELVFEH